MEMKFHFLMLDTTWLRDLRSCREFKHNSSVQCSEKWKFPDNRPVLGFFEYIYPRSLKPVAIFSFASLHKHNIITMSIITGQSYNREGKEKKKKKWKTYLIHNPSITNNYRPLVILLWSLGESLIRGCRSSIKLSFAKNVSQWRRSVLKLITVLQQEVFHRWS